MHRTLTTILASTSLLAFTAVAFAAEPAGATVTLKKLLERRELSVEKTPFSGWENGIELLLHVEGPGVKGARKFGKLKITEAKDDAGTDLTKVNKDAPKFMTDHFEDVREPQQFGFGSDEKKNPKPTGFDVTARLQTPTARTAKTLKILKGELQVLVGGEKKIVEVKKLKETFGKPLADPALKELGVTFTINDPAAKRSGFSFGDPKKSLPVVIAGNVDAIAGVTILDAAGQKMNAGSSWSDEKNKRALTYDLEKDFSEDMTLQIEVWPGQRTLTVPFELKDVKLP